MIIGYIIVLICTSIGIYLGIKEMFSVRANPSLLKQEQKGRDGDIYLYIDWK